MRVVSVPEEGTEMTPMNIEIVPITDLRPRAGNPRTHSKKQIRQLAASITKFGFVNPVLTDGNGCLVAGHGRIEAAQLVGLTEVPTIRLADMSEAEIRAYVIADNQLAANAGWDKSLLAVEFAYLSALEIDFDLTVTGFEAPEIDAFLGVGDPERQTDDPDDDAPAVAETAVSQLGDVWQIGQHRLICGDATQDMTYADLLGDERAVMIFADAPYNVPINGHVSGLGKHKHREFAMASGEMAPAQFVSFLSTTFSCLSRWSIKGSIHFQCIDWRSLREMLEAGSANYSELKNLCVWAKTNGGMGSLYRSAHELVLVFKSGSEPHINNVELGKNGRFRTNVWNYAGANSFGRSRDQDLAMHPTVKPVMMVADAMLDCSRRKDIVLDPFAGSGTTLVAAQRTRRRGYGIELDPLYCDVIVRRMQKLFKLVATRTSDGQTFDTASSQRPTLKPWETAA
jgi:DNA modification methylase